MKVSRRMRKFIVLCGLAAALSASSAHATLRSVFLYTSFGHFALLELNGGAQIRAAAEGWFDDTGYHDNVERNYVAGVCGDWQVCNATHDVYYRDFFAFDLSADGAPATSASLLIWNPGLATDNYNGYGSSEPSEIFRLWDVHTPFSVLNSWHQGRVDVYDDLGTGTFYGQTAVSAADNGTWVRVALNGAALDAINGAAGGTIAFGGSLASIGPIPQVPEPQTIGLLLGGLGLLAWRVRRN
jgi:hypothetical protein